MSVGCDVPHIYYVGHFLNRDILLSVNPRPQSTPFCAPLCPRDFRTPMQRTDYRRWQRLLQRRTHSTAVVKRVSYPLKSFGPEIPSYRSLVFLVQP